MAKGTPRDPRENRNRKVITVAIHMRTRHRRRWQAFTRRSCARSFRRHVPRIIGSIDSRLSTLVSITELITMLMPGGLMLASNLRRGVLHTIADRALQISGSRSRQLLNLAQDRSPRRCHQWSRPPYLMISTPAHLPNAIRGLHGP